MVVGGNLVEEGHTGVAGLNGDVMRELGLFLDLNLVMSFLHEWGQ